METSVDQEVQQEEPTAIELACIAVGGETNLAKAVQISPQAVWQWVKKRRVPADRVIEVERVSGVSRHKLRPDIYPEQSA